MGFGRYRFRRSFGNVSSQFRGARFDTYPLFTGILDDFPGAAAAYSLRALSSAWLAGDVVEVRRSSDSSTQSFTAGQVVDGTLTAFCGVGDGFVSTLYDQSGLGADLLQVVTTQQPKIVDSGSLVVGGMSFDGVDDFLETNSASSSSQPFTTFLVSAPNAASQAFFDANMSDAFLISSGTNFPQLAAGATLTGSTTIPLSTDSLITCAAISTSSEIFIDGVSVASGDAGTNGLTSDLRVGRWYRGSARYLSGGFSELIVYPSDQSANRTGIETNINEYYSIY